ncbi:MAG: hypothetical protein WDO74_05095 [Pseudomonadota bacterium]
MPHDLKIGNGSASFTDVAGNWASNWAIESFDNELHRFQLVFGSGSGPYLPVGKSLNASHELSGTLLTLQFVLQGAGTCTSATDGAPLPDCKLYIKRN